MTSFSILTQEFKKSEIKTVEELSDIIVNSPISPKPKCESLSYIWNWRDHIVGHLASKKLKHHSFYHAFKVTKENNQVKLRVKRLPQDVDWLPATGIRLYEPSSSVFEPVPVAEFRVEDLLLSKIIANLEKYLRRMPTHIRCRVADSWMRLKENLEKLPRMKNNLPQMKLETLPKLTVESAEELPDEYSFIEIDRQEYPAIEGDVYEKPSSHLSIYTECK